MSENETNIKLIEAVARGERRACDAIVRQFGQTMFGIIAHMVADRRDAEELDNVTRIVNAQGRTETYTNVLPRYALLHVVYRFNKQPKKK